MIRILLSFFLCASFFSYAQKYDHVWLFGYGSSPDNQEFGGSTIDFNLEPLDIFYEFREMNINIANASICDTSGNLLMYSNGNYIANAIHEEMENGDGLSPGLFHSSNGFIMEQGIIFLPRPGNSSRYIALHLSKTFDDGDLAPNSPQFFYSIIDMDANAGLGSVISKNNVLIDEKLNHGKITAVKHANGQDWWVLIRTFDTPEYYTILIDSTSVQVTEIQEIGEPLPFPGLGQAVFSPDGTKFVMYSGVTIELGNFLDIYDFDRCTGKLSNPIQINIIDEAWSAGAAISPNSRFLYVSSYNYIYQYDLWAEDIAATKDTVAIYDGFLEEPIFRTRFFLAQLAPNGKIYLSSSNSSHFLHVINNPNLPGEACDVCQHCFKLPTWNAFSMPNFPNYRLGPLETACDTTVATSTVDQFTFPNIALYPNSANDYFKVNIQSDDLQDYKITLTNNLGQIVLEQALSNTKENKFNVDFLPSGLYFYSIQSKTRKVKSGKLIVIKH
jgi:hypothetical protein